MRGVTAIAAGNSHSLALKSDGSVWTWGKLLGAPLGTAAGQDNSKPGQVPGMTYVVAISAGGEFSLALESDGRVWSWGGEPEYGSKPELLRGLTGVVAVGAFESHILALRSDGPLWSWGRNDDGVLGHGNAITTIPSPAPMMVTALNGVVAVSGASSHSLALKGDGTVWAWGDNSEGQLGDGLLEHRSDEDQFRTAPGLVPGLKNIVAISGGTYHSVALRRDGTVWTWGRNAEGQLGSWGPEEVRHTPVLVRRVQGSAPVAAAASRD